MVTIFSRPRLQGPRDHQLNARNKLRKFASFLSDNDSNESDSDSELKRLESFNKQLFDYLGEVTNHNDNLSKSSDSKIDSEIQSNTNYTKNLVKSNFDTDFGLNELDDMIEETLNGMSIAIEEHLGCDAMKIMGIHERSISNSNNKSRNTESSESNNKVQNFAKLKRARFVELGLEKMMGFPISRENWEKESDNHIVLETSESESSDSESDSESSESDVSDSNNFPTSLIDFQKALQSGKLKMTDKLRNSYTSKFLKLTPIILCCSSLLYAKYLTVSTMSVTANTKTFTGIFGNTPILSMMPPIPGFGGSENQVETPSIMDFLFPKSVTSRWVSDTEADSKRNSKSFLKRISILQMLEYCACLLLTMGSNWQADTYESTRSGVDFTLSPNTCSLFLLGASYGPSLVRGDWWRMITPVMQHPFQIPSQLHANLLHIFFNMLFQSRIGYGIEDQLGPRRFMLVYLFCGFSGNLLSLLADSQKLAVGASTSAFGLIGVWLAESHLTWHLTRTDSKLRLAMWFSAICSSFLIMCKVAPHLDVFGHIGGLTGGYLFSIAMASMEEEYRPWWYDSAKNWSRLGLTWWVVGGSLKLWLLNPSLPMPKCGKLLHPNAYM